jgi:hypothetical protein
MALRVTRPGFIEGIRAYKKDPSYDPNTQASRQEMRAFVCGQCHVEYYFKGADKRLTFPWSKGMKADEILAYYDEVGFRDWTHKLSGAPALKAQHPEFEMWNQGVHARSGVACADCHMPYMRVGGTKVSDHWVRSPVLNLNRACQSCHKWPEEELKARVEGIQDKHMKLRENAFDALVALVGDIEAAKAAGKTDAELEPARYLQRRAQFPSTSSRRRTRPASTRRRRPPACCSTPSTPRARGSSRCATRSSSRRWRSSRSRRRPLRPRPPPRRWSRRRSRSSGARPASPGRPAGRGGPPRAAVPHPVRLRRCPCRPRS